MAVALWIIRRTEYFGGRVGAVKADPEIADVLVKRGDAQLVERGVKLQKLDRGAPAPKANGKKKKAKPADDTTKTDAAASTPAPEDPPEDPPPPPPPADDA